MNKIIQCRLIEKTARLMVRRYPVGPYTIKNLKRSKRQLQQQLEQGPLVPGLSPAPKNRIKQKIKHRDLQIWKARDEIKRRLAIIKHDRRNIWPRKLFDEGWI